MHGVKNVLKIMKKRTPFFLVTSLQGIVSDKQFCTRGSKHGMITKEKSWRGEEKHIKKKEKQLLKASRVGTGNGVFFWWSKKVIKKH